jgi:hypothetical protein
MNIRDFQSASLPPHSYAAMVLTMRSSSSAGSGRRLQWGRFAAITVLVSCHTPNPMRIGWFSCNSNILHTRTVSVALYNMAAQVQEIISLNIHRQDNRPMCKYLVAKLICESFILMLYIAGTTEFR